MAKKLIIANWKMNPSSLKEAKALAGEVRKVATQLKHVTTVLCPPTVFLHPLSTRPNVSVRNGRASYKLQATSYTLGAQSCYHDKQGSHTGQISAEMIAKTGARYLLLGHSELRAEGETSAQVAKKINCALDVGLHPILCIGEKVRDEHGFYVKYIAEQLTESLAGVSKKRIALLTIVYEPLWAISNSELRPATPEESQEMVLYLRKLLAAKIGIGAAKAIPVLYGGSVDAKNCASFLQHGGVQGFLVGHASLDSKQFSAILQITEKLH